LYENPLLPNRKLQELYALMQRMRGLTRKTPALRGLEAMLAASLMQLEPGDFVSSLPGLPAAESLAAERTSVPSKAVPATLPVGQRLAAAAGIAQGFQLSKDSRLSIVFATAGAAEPGWQEALTYSAKARLPLILLCADTPPARARKPAANTLTSAAMIKLAAPLHLPVLSVDGADAVAVYRVMQESILRGRTLGGTAVVWCSLPAASPKAGAVAVPDPLVHMRRYLSDRKLLPAK
jgi:pyruvate dehydrogenase E1 component alpha subunit